MMVRIRRFFIVTRATEREAPGQSVDCEGLEAKVALTAMLVAHPGRPIGAIRGRVAGETTFTGPYIAREALPPHFRQPSPIFAGAAAAFGRIIGNGHQIEVQFAGNSDGPIVVGGETFGLPQFRDRDAAEGLAIARGLAMGGHFVNVSESEGETVALASLQLGAHNEAPGRAFGAVVTDVAAIDRSGSLPKGMEGWHSVGLLPPVPPLSGPAGWSVIATPIALDPRQFAQDEQVVGGPGFFPEARPVHLLDEQMPSDIAFQHRPPYELDFAIASQSPGAAIA